MSKEYPWGKGTVTRVYDSTANDSDKNVLTVPAGKIVEITSIFVTLASTATVGNRIMGITVSDGANILLSLSSQVLQGASTTGYYLWYNTAVFDSTLSYTSMAIPPLRLPAGYIVRVYDLAAIDAAADDMTVAVMYTEYDA